VATRYEVPQPLLFVGKRFFLLSDHLALRGHFGIQLNVTFPFIRNIILVENCLDRTLWDTGLAIDAFFGMNVEDFLIFVEALHGTNYHTVGVLAVLAWFANNMGHGQTSP
jgi:hypothetical protein